MTWKEFKEFVDEKLKKLNISEDIEIDYIDISAPCTDHEMCIPNIDINKRYGLSIT